MESKQSQPIENIAQLRTCANTRRRVKVSLSTLARRAGIGYQKLWRAEHDVEGVELSERELTALTRELKAIVLERANCALGAAEEILSQAESAGVAA